MCPAVIHCLVEEKRLNTFQCVKVLFWDTVFISFISLQMVNNTLNVLVLPEQSDGNLESNLLYGR